MKRTVGYVAFRRALSIIFLPKAILAFVYMCLLLYRSIHQAMHLVQTQSSQSPCTTNIFLPKAILAFVYMCLLLYRSIHQAMHLVQTQSSLSPCTTNISRHLFFLFTRNNYTSGNRNIFAVSLLKFVSK